MMNRRLVFLVIFFSFLLRLSGQEIKISGTVTDSITGERLPYASLLIKGTAVGTATDADGGFSLAIPAGKQACVLTVSYLGYDTKEMRIVPGKGTRFDILLAPSGISLEEVVVKPKRERYRKKDNPAVAFVREMIDRRRENNPRDHDYFRYDHYEKILFAMNEYTPKPSRPGKEGKFDFLVEFVDTLNDGVTILPLSEKEQVSTVYYRRDPESEKRLVRASQSSGVDEILSRDGVRQFLDEAFREVDIFRNDIPLFLQRFVSPLSSIGPNYYKYYLLDSLEVDGESCVDLGFVPFNSETFGFTGHLYVTLDSTYFVKRAVLNVPKDINLNFVSRMTIEQTFERTADQTRLITKDDIRVNFKLSEKSKGMYARRLNMYSHHSFEEPSAKEAWVFDESAPVIIQEDAYRKAEGYWSEVRPGEAKRKNTHSVGELMARLRSVPVFYVTEKVVSTLVSGYIPTHKDPARNKFEFGPMNSTFNGNTIEGARFRVGGGTTPALNKHWLADGYMAYGTKDRKLKYDALVEYSFNERKDYRLEYPMHSIRLEYMYDLNKMGEQYMYTGKDNMVLAIRRKKDTRATYLRKAELTYTREHYNGISYGAVVRNLREYATPYAEFNRFEADGSLTPVDHYDLTALELRFRYGRNERFYQTRTQRVPITFDALIFNFSHVMAKKGFLGSSYDYQRTDVGVQKRF